MSLLRSLTSRESLLAVIVLLATGSMDARAAVAQVPRVLIVGDSWAQQTLQAGAMDAALANRGFAEMRSLGTSTSESGSTAAQWAQPDYLARIRAELEAQPTLDVIHLSVGGNDVLGAPAGSDFGAVANAVFDHVQTIADFVHAIRPEAKVVLQTYDYVPAEGGNAPAIELARVMVTRAAAADGILVNDNLGYLHHRFGYPGRFEAGETAAPGNHPEYEPLAGGDPAVPGDPARFRDDLHPTPASYVALCEHAIDAMYGPWLAPTPELATLGLSAASLVAAMLVLVGVTRLRRRRESVET